MTPREPGAELSAPPPPRDEHGVEHGEERRGLAETKRPLRTRRGLASFSRLRLQPAQLLIGILCGLVGFGTIVQINETGNDDLSDLRQSDLVRILGDSTRRADELETESRNLQDQLKDLEQGDRSDSEIAKASQKRLQSLQILAGTAPAAGPGIKVRIVDPRGSLRSASLLGTIQELRNAGAEVLQIGSVRVVASSYFIKSGSGIEVDGQILKPPYIIRAIGDPAVMDPALKIPGGAADTVAADGATLSVDRSEEIKVSAIVKVTTKQYARTRG